MKVSEVNGLEWVVKVFFCTEVNIIIISICKRDAPTDLQQYKHSPGDGGHRERQTEEKTERERGGVLRF